ncbi:inositol monophosphatase family protein [Pyrofollis japonicus]|uniref:inositol monophosphatase family protein n=1 Tax=Pyrofollis japonicus TaxID=3060460 RepID=UPI00295ACB41|nr:inositol monophosphatase family protein [Pyrofollis japonicus]
MLEVSLSVFLGAREKLIIAPLLKRGRGSLLAEPIVERREAEDLRRMVSRIAGEAAAYLRDRFGLEELLETKDIHSYDTDESMIIDYESEENVIELLKAEGFRGLFIGEEHGFVKLGDDPYIAVVDPLDGSKNYASMIPWSAVSIAIARIPRDREPRLGDVLAGAVAPILSMPVLSFARGIGAFEGASHIQRPRVPPRLILAYVEEPEQAKVVHTYLSLQEKRGSVRALGSASLEMAWTGIGRAEVFIDVRGRLRIVDVAAAAFFAKEAGATVIVERPDARLDRVDRVGSVLVASNKDAEHRLYKALEISGFGYLAERKL